MYNRRFFDAVRHRLINATQTAVPRPAADADTSRVTVFVDYQNLFYLLRKAYEVFPSGVHIPNLISDLLATYGLKPGEIFLYTGVPSPTIAKEASVKMEKRLAWLRHLGVKVRTNELSYFTDRVSGKLVARERGIDVMLATELMVQVQAGANQILVISNDQGIAQAIRIAEDVALGQGRTLEAYSVIATEVDLKELARKEICAEGIDFTLRLELPKSMVERHQIKLVPQEQPFFETISAG